MVVFRGALTLACVFLLSGCFVTKEEPFSLDDGAILPFLRDAYLSCVRHYSDGSVMLDEQGAYAKEEILPIELRRNNKTQYALAKRGKSLTNLNTFHHIKPGIYLLVSAVFSSRGEIIQLVQVNEKKFVVYSVLGNARKYFLGMAQKHGVLVGTQDKYGLSLDGPVKAQRTFLIDAASDVSKWKMEMSCDIIVVASQ